MEELLAALARLDARLGNLEARVSTLEGCSQPVASRSIQAAAHLECTVSAEPLVAQTESMVSVTGKAMLGIAGAYVLRAIAESGWFPKLAIVVLALAYAAMWLVWAARPRAAARFTRIAYAATSALILMPMLAELTLRFQFLPSPVTAGLLGSFVIAASALAWKRHLSAVAGVCGAAAVLSALALLIVSRDMVPYTVALLAMAAISEIAAASERWPSLRLLVAPATDIAVLILVYIYSLPLSSRLDYAAVSEKDLLAVPSFLFLIYGASIAWRSVLLRHRITIFEIVQAATVFFIFSLSWLWFAPVIGHKVLGVSSWLLSTICYAAAFLRFDRETEQRNYHVYSTWSVALALFGCFLVLPPPILVLLLSVISLVATWAGVRMARLTPEFHGLLYLTAAAFSSGLLQYGTRALAGTFPAAPGWMVWVVAVAALLCYTIGGRYRGERWNERFMRLLAATIAVSAVATFLISCLVWFEAVGMTPSAVHVAVIRTLITCALSLALAFGGAHLCRFELVWTAYGTLIFVAAKLLFEDLPHGQSASIAISIFLFAVALILVPRIAHARPLARK